MSKYTYHIKLGGSDYVEVFPANRIQIRGYWEDDSWFDRVELSSEVKICRKDNQSIYDSISSWRTDPAQFSVECFFQIKSNGSALKTFLFNPRWGKIDYETAVYTFKPEIYDSYLLYWKDFSNSNLIAPVGSIIQRFYNNTGNMTYIDGRLESSGNYLFNLFEDIIAEKQPSLTAKSTILNNDTNYDGNTITATNGIILDYVTGDWNYFLKGMIAFASRDKSFSDILDIYKIFNIVPFFESPDSTNIRLDHVKWLFNYMNANTYNITFNDDDHVYEFIDPLLPRNEIFKFEDIDTATDVDFTEKEIKYPAQRIGLAGNTIKNDYRVTNNYNSLYVYNPSDYITYDKIIAGTNQQILLYTYPQGTGGAGLSYNRNAITWNPFGVDKTHYIYSNDFRATSGSIYDFECYVSAIDGNPGSYIRVDVIDRSGGYSLSGYQTLSTGYNSFSLTITGSTSNDACMRIIVYYASIIGPGFNGWFTCRNSTAAEMRTVYEVCSVSGLSKMNGPFSTIGIIENWMSLYRPTNKGTINGSDYIFTDSQFTYRRETKKRYYPNDINMKYGVNDGTRIAKIEQYTRDLDTDYVQFTLLYQEDE